MNIIAGLSLLSIWFSIINSLLVLFAAAYFWIKQSLLITSIEPLKRYPRVAIVIPAHNEELVIVNTIEAVINLNYPKKSWKLYVYADNCIDNTAQVVRDVFERKEYADFQLNLIERTGKGGKAGVLNDALKRISEEYIAVYDADAIPEKNALYFLIKKVLEKPNEYMAVFGRNKTRNANQNLLTRFINQETITSQRIQHVGMWNLFKIGRIPGTNFIINTKFTKSIGGWKQGALTEDTDISFEIYKAKKFIALAHNSEAFEQEVETLSAYYHQRMRWAKGNYHVIINNMKFIFKNVPWRVKYMTISYAMTFFWLICAVVFSDILFIVTWSSMGLHFINPEFHIIKWELFGNNYSLSILFLNWILMILIYILNINIGLATQYGQPKPEQLWLSVLSYFTYAQLFVYVSIMSLWSVFLDKCLNRDKTKWIKTERFNS